MLDPHPKALMKVDPMSPAFQSRQGGSFSTHYFGDLSSAHVSCRRTNDQWGFQGFRVMVKGVVPNPTMDTDPRTLKGQSTQSGWKSFFRPGGRSKDVGFRCRVGCRR